MTPEEELHARERAALAAYCPVHRAEPGRPCILLDGVADLAATTGVCATRLAEVPSHLEENGDAAWLAGG